MTPAELERAGQELFGESWKSQLANALGIDASTLWRFQKREEASGPATAAVSAWLLLYRAFLILPPETPTGDFRRSHPRSPALPDDGWTGSLEEFDQAAADLFGDKWKGLLAKALGIDTATLWRQTTRDDGLPGPVTAAIRSWVLIHRMTGLKPPSEPGGPMPAPMHAAEAPKPPQGRKKMPKYASLLLEGD